MIVYNESGRDFTFDEAEVMRFEDADAYKSVSYACVKEMDFVWAFGSEVWLIEAKGTGMMIRLAGGSKQFESLVSDLSGKAACALAMLGAAGWETQFGVLLNPDLPATSIKHPGKLMIVFVLDCQLPNGVNLVNASYYLGALAQRVSAELLPWRTLFGVQACLCVDVPTAQQLGIAVS